MINVDKLLKSERIEVYFADTKIDKEFVKKFRRHYNLTQSTLANIVGVSKKTVEKWEQGANNVNGSSAVLLKLLNDNPCLIDQLYKVKRGVSGKIDSDEYSTFGCVSTENKVDTISQKKSYNVTAIIKPMVALF